MSMQMQAPVKTTSVSGFTPHRTGFLQRKCGCGDHMMASGECAECSKKKRFGLQTKLMVNEPGDIYEREADRIADQVTAAHHTVSGPPPRIQRLAGQPKGQTTAAPASVNRALAGSGRPLEPALRQEMEQRIGHDFSRVMVYSDAAASQSAKEMNANAYTTGRNIVFGEGRFAPGTREGQRLIAHELTHVVQQSGGSSPSVQRQPKKYSPKDDWWPPDFKLQFPDSPIDPPSTRSVAEGICKLQPSNPICEFYHITPPPSSKTICAPGYHGSTSSTYKDQCCKDGQPDSKDYCCPKEQMGDGRCCVAGEVADDGHCKKSGAFDPSKLCVLPGRKAPTGECCYPPKVPGFWGCEEKKEEPPKPLVFDTFVNHFTVLFNKDQPRTGQSFESSLAGGRGELDQAINLLKKDFSTGAQLVANASKEGEPGHNLELTDRRLEVVRAEMKDVNWKVRDPMPPIGDMTGCRGSWGAYSCGTKNADQKTVQASDRNVSIRLFRPTEPKLAPQSPLLKPPKSET